MRLLPESINKYLSEEVTTFVTCWKLLLKNGSIMGFTNCNYSITIDGILYNATTSVMASALENSVGTNVDNLEIEAIIDSDNIKEKDILAGLYDFAELEIFMINYLDPDAGTVLLKRGYLGEITVKNKRFIAEIRGLTQKLNQVIGNSYSLNCRASFGDKYCKINKEKFSYEGTVGEVLSNNHFRDSGRRENENYFKYGELHFISGNNVGLFMEVKEYKPGVIITVLSFPYDIKTEDNYKIVAGCNKKFNTCCVRYNNAVNFRGEPHLPGTGQILKTAGTTEF